MKQKKVEKIQLAIIEDDAVIRKNLQAFMGANPAIVVRYVAESVEAFIQTIKEDGQAEADILLLDIGLPGMSGLEGIAPIKQLLPTAEIIMLTTYEEEETIFKALCAGAVAYLSKRTSLSKIQEALFVIHRGGSYMSPSIARKVVAYFAPVQQEKASLTDRQLQIVQGVVDGLSYKLIADKYMISIDTVRDHIKKIYRALNINSKSELVKKALKGEL